MKGTFKPPILGSFEDIGKDIVSETAKVPTEIVGKILESLTGSTGAKGQQNQQQQKPDGALGKIEQTNDQQVKKSIARSALQQLAAPKQQEPTLFEQKQKEERQKKETAIKQQEKVAMQELPRMSSKKRRGDLYGIKGKSSTEMSKNVRQD
jgi:hypothetical protein